MVLPARPFSGGWLFVVGTFFGSHRAGRYSELCRVCMRTALGLTVCMPANTVGNKTPLTRQANKTNNRLSSQTLPHASKTPSGLMGFKIQFLLGTLRHKSPRQDPVLFVQRCRSTTSGYDFTCFRCTPPSAVTNPAANDTTTVTSRTIIPFWVLVIAIHHMLRWFLELTCKLTLLPLCSQEPKVENSGITQGTFVKRHRIPKPESLGGVELWLRFGNRFAG